MTIECARELRAGMEAIANALGAIAVAVRPSLEPSGCTHPDEVRDHTGATMGHPRWTCTSCGFTYDAKGAA
jgi:transposase-like protein